MESYKQSFIHFLIDNKALRFGNFTLKSGRKSPFFMNLGNLNEGWQVRKLGEAYAEAILDQFGYNLDVVFGPAYKGIPLATATAAELDRHGLIVSYCSNRKEVKDHGDTGILLGHKLQDGDRVVIVEDVTTSGKSIDETVPIIRAQANVEIVGLVVSLDRHERGTGDKTALAEISDKYGFPTASIISMPEVVELGEEEGFLTDQQVKEIDSYYWQYGPKE